MLLANANYYIPRLSPPRESIKVGLQMEQRKKGLLTQLETELAKEGIPLPFGSKFWASNWPTGKSPLPGLIVHLIPSVSLSFTPALARELTKIRPR